MMTTCPGREQLSGYVLGLLPEGAFEEIAEHVEQCPSCEATVLTLEGAPDTVISALRGPVPADPVFAERACQRAVEQIQALVVDSVVEARGVLETPMPPDSDVRLAFLTPAKSADEMGRLGSYRVLRKLGAGGMGIVFLAEDVQLKRQVALKILHPEVAARRGARERFLREAQAAATLEHEHIVTIFQVGQESGVPFFAMQLLKGMSLEDRLRHAEGVRPPALLSIPQILRLGRQIGRGLAAAHERGLIHRDIKPANLWLEPEHGGHVKILDFGLARAVEDEAHLTQSGAMVGTPAYMAPEQARAEKLDHRCDLFSLGVVLYRLCTGRLPFRGDNTMAVLTALAMDAPKPLRDLNPAVPPELADLVMQLLNKIPAMRPASAKEVAERLHALERVLTVPVATAVAVPVQPAASANPWADIDVTEPIGKAHPESAKGVQTSLGASPRPSKTPGVPPRRRRALVAAFAAAAMILLAGITTFRIATDKGDLVIKTDESVEITVKRNGKPVEDLELKTGENVTRVYSGDIEVVLKGANADAFVVKNNRITLKRGDKLVVEIERKVAGAPDRKAAEWVLSLGGTVIINDGQDREIKTVENLPAGAWTLRALNLEGKPGVTDAGLKELAGLKQLQWLNLVGTLVTDAGLKELAGLKQLQWLSLVRSRVTDAGLKELAGLKQLRGLNLVDTEVTDAGLKQLAALIDLTEVRLSSTKVTAAGVAALQKALPKCKIAWDGREIPDRKAIVLMGGNDLSGWTTREGKPARWKAGDGYVEVVSGSGDIMTKEKFGPDFELHVEFWLPNLPPEIKDQARANSGVFLQGRYEIQVLDSYKNETYANGTVGALFGIIAPDKTAQAKAVKPPEQWNTFDITFHAPRVNPAGNVTKKGRVSVTLNGLKITEGDFSEVTGGNLDHKIGEPGPILLQDHHNKGDGPNVRFRNIWLRPKAELPIRSGDANADRRAAEWVLSVGGTLRVMADGKLIEVPKEPLPKGLFRVKRVVIAAKADLKDADIENLGCLTELEELEMWHNPQLGNDSLKPLASVTNLRVLNVRGNVAVNDAGVQALRGNKNLQSLNLNDCLITNASMPHIAEFTELKHLDLGGTRITDAGMAHLRKLTKLEAVCVSSPNITGPGYDHLKALPELRGLGIRGKVQPSIWKYIGQLDRIESLGLNDSTADDAALAHLKGMTKLKHLELHRTPVTDAGLMDLKELTNLTHLGIDPKVTPNVTPAGLNALRKAMPNCVINGKKWEGDADRRAAEWVLSIGGRLRVRIEDEQVDIAKLTDLPSQPFQVTEVFWLWDARFQDVKGLKNLAGLPGLSAIFVETKKRLDERAFAFFKEMPGLNKLWIQCGGIELTASGLDDLVGCKKLESLRVYGWQQNDQDCKKLSQMTQLRELQLASPQITPKGFAELANLKILDRLHIATPISAASLEQIKRLKKLRLLHIAGATDEGLVHVGELTNMGELRLYDAKLTDDGMKPLANLAKLQSLDIEKAPLHGSGLEHLQRLKNLTSLGLDGTQVTDDGLEKIRPMTWLRGLVLNRCSRITNDGLAHLTALTDLQDLQLTGTNVTDAGLKHLKGLTNLTVLYLGGTKVTAEGVAALSKALPKCKIAWDGGVIEPAK
jgi:serine/threonine protein kinase/Leucine-rich repeat (LRR) protein